MENNEEMNIEEREVFNGQYRDGDRVFVDKPLKDIVEAEGQAVKSLVLGVLGIVFSQLIFGFILGIIAIKKSKHPRTVLNQKHHKYHIATAGEITGWVSIGLSILAVFIWIAFIVLFVAIYKNDGFNFSFDFTVN